MLGKHEIGLRAPEPPPPGRTTRSISQGRRHGVTAVVGTAPSTGGGSTWCPVRVVRRYGAAVRAAPRLFRDKSSHALGPNVLRGV